MQSVPEDPHLHPVLRFSKALRASVASHLPISYQTLSYRVPISLPCSVTFLGYLDVLGCLLMSLEDSPCSLFKYGVLERSLPSFKLFVIS